MQQVTQPNPVAADAVPAVPAFGVAAVPVLGTTALPAEKTVGQKLRETCLGQAVFVQGIIMLIVEIVELIGGFLMLIWGIGFFTSVGAILGIIGASVIVCGCCCKDGRGRWIAHGVLAILAAVFAIVAGSMYAAVSSHVKDLCDDSSHSLSSTEKAECDHLNVIDLFAIWEFCIAVLRITLGAQSLALAGGCCAKPEGAGGGAV